MNDSDDDEKIPEHIIEVRDKVFVQEHGLSHVHAIRDPDAFMGWGVDSEWTERKFLKKFSIKVISMTDEENDPLQGDAKDVIGSHRGHESKMEVDIIGIDPGIANALRRIMIGEVPSIAIDVVNVFQNTSIFCDEVLCHRIGLVPLRVDPDKLEQADIALAEDDCSYKPIEENHDFDPSNALLFTIKAKCSNNPKAPPLADEKLRYINSEVYSKHLTWVPQGDQEERFGDFPPKPLYEDILIAKLRPGQEIEMECFAIKGIGKIHAKWSPVCPVSYRLMPEVQFVVAKTLPREWFRGNNTEEEPEGSTFGKTFVLVKPPGLDEYILGNIEKTYDRTDMMELGANDIEPTVDVSIPEVDGTRRVYRNIKLNSPMIKPAPQVWDDNARRLKKMCPKNVFDIEDVLGHVRPVVARPRDCTMCRECIRHPGWAQRMKLRRRRDHYIFQINSVGQYKARDLLTRAVQILRGKVSTLRDELGALRKLENNS